MGSFRELELDCERVLQADRLENGSQFVIAVGPLVEDAQIEVELGERRNGDAARLILQQREDVVVRQLLRARSGNVSSITKPSPATLPPSSRTRRATAEAVPPVARTSSMIRTLWPGSMRVGVDFELIRAVFEVVFDAADDVRQLLRFAHRNESGAERVRHGRSEEIAARLDADHDVDRVGRGNVR